MPRWPASSDWANFKVVMVPDSRAYTDEMFGLFKPRASCEDLSAFLAARFTILLWPGIDAGVDEELNLMVECGAAEDRIRPEIAAFCAFAYFRGIVEAFESSAITTAQRDRLENAYTRELDQKVRVISPDHIPSLEYDTFADWLFARLQRYALVAASATNTNDVTKMLVAHFSDFACNESPTEILSKKFNMTFENTVANTMKLITSHRLR